MAMQRFRPGIIKLIVQYQDGERKVITFKGDIRELNGWGAVKRLLKK